jgi:hypothetical protein
MFYIFACIASIVISGETLTVYLLKPKNIVIYVKSTINICLISILIWYNVTYDLYYEQILPILLIILHIFICLYIWLNEIYFTPTNSHIKFENVEPMDDPFMDPDLDLDVDEGWEDYSF